MLTAHPDPAVATDLPLNTFWDGLFHVFASLATVAGVVLVWRAWRRHETSASVRTHLGGVLVGWVVFNLVEGVLDHHLLGIHHVWPAAPGSVLLWDLAFLALGAALVGAEYGVLRTAPAAAPRDEADGVAGD